MLAMSNGRLVNPFRAGQVREKIDKPDRKLRNFNEWELPTGATAEMVQGEPTISSPQELSGQLNRIYARFVWSKAIPRHLNPRAPEKGDGGLYQLAKKASFDSVEREGYLTSIFLRISGWSPGARRRGNDERKLYMCSGGPFCLFNAYCLQYGQISAGSW